jgi:hypothetical protein
MRTFWMIQGIVLFALVTIGIVVIQFAHRSKESELRSFESVRASAEAGNARDQYYLGLRYSTGQGAPQDYSKALECYRKAADKGDPMGENGLGFLYSSGRGVPQDYAVALSWYRKAAVLGNSKAQFNLANAYLYGRGVQQNINEAGQWFAMAADQGDEDAQRAIGMRWTGGDINSRIILPIVSLATILYLAGLFWRGRGNLDGQGRILALTASIGSSYLIITVFLLQQENVILPLQLDHASYFVMNIIIGMYAIQVFSLLWSHKAKLRGNWLVMGTVCVLLVGFNVFMGMHFGVAGEPSFLRLFFLANGLLIGIIVPPGLSLLGVWTARGTGGWPRSAHK